MKNEGPFIYSALIQRRLTISDKYDKMIINIDTIPHGYDTKFIILEILHIYFILSDFNILYEIAIRRRSLEQILSSLEQILRKIRITLTKPNLTLPLRTYFTNYYCIPSRKICQDSYLFYFLASSQT